MITLEQFIKKAGNLLKIPIGVTLVFLFTFLLFSSKHLIAPESLDHYNNAMILYGLFLAIAFSSSDSRERLFKVSTFAFLTRFVLFFIPFLVIFSIIFGFAGVEGSGLFTALATFPLWQFIIMIFMFVTIESLVQVWAMDRVGWLPTSILFGVLHMFVWTGTNLFNVIASTIIFIIFSFVHYRFRKNDADLAPLIGVHGGYNIAQMI